MSTLGALGEFGFIARATAGLAAPPGVLAGVGDDCAVVRCGGRVLLYSCDASIEDVHFSRAWCAPYDIGWKAAASAFSDIAAMGGAAEYALAALACPSDTPLAFLDELTRGAHECVAACGAALIGGDTTRSPGPLMLNFTVTGHAPEGRYLRRSGARPGDVLAHTGACGWSAAGLAALRRGLEAPEAVRAHLRPAPRLAEGRWLAARPGVRAMMDISDGLLQDAGHLAAAAGLTADIGPDLPRDERLEELARALHAGAADWILRGGEDYELLIAADPAEFDALRVDFEAEFGLPLRAAGRFREGPPRALLRGADPGPGGFDHFR